MFSLELGRRATEAKVPILSNAAHPGYARTNLQTSGPGKPQSYSQKLLASFLSQDAAHGALPSLRAATSPDMISGDYFGPDRMMGMMGDPVLIKIPKPAMNEAAARKLWETAEKLTGTPFAFD